jgi:signal transduction histidine kinase
MICLAIILIALSIVILRKEKGDTRIFLFLLTASWIVSVFCFIAYIQYLDHNYLYQSLLASKMPITKLLPSSLIGLFGTADRIITAMNLGIVIFIYSALCFPLSFLKPLKKNGALYLFLAIPPFLQFLIYSPWIYECIYRFLFVSPYQDIISFADFYGIDEKIHVVTGVVNHGYVAFGFVMMLYNYFRTSKIRYFRSYYLLIASGYTSIILLFITFLWWSPKRMVSLTTAENSMHFFPVSILVEGNIIEFYPYIMLLSFMMLLLALYRFNHLYFSMHSVRTNIFRSFDITNSGIRFYNHMVKNFAMAVLVDAESLKQKIGDAPAASLHADRIIRNSQELLTTLNGIRSRFTVTSLNLCVSDVNEIMERALDHLKQENVSLRYSAEGSPFMVLLDPQHMKEVFTNILNNSMQAMEDDPRLLTVEMRRNNAWADISISDNGRGIEKQNLDKIFMPFYSTSDRQENWGLGLSYCYRVVMAHQGRIFVDSELGKGTTVKILLPLNEEE